jgi:hypothetical protein
LGNNLQESYGYSSDRLQLNQITASYNTTNFLTLNYGYCGLTVGSCATNNGNVQNQAMTHQMATSDDFTSDVFEDQGGNLWAGTRGGLDRLRDGPFRTLGAKEGLIGDSGPVAADHGAVWTTFGGRVDRIAASELSTWRLALPSVAQTITSLSSPDSEFLIGFNGGVVHWSPNGAAATIPALAGLDVDCLLKARDGIIWIGTTNRGLLPLPDGRGSDLSGARLARSVPVRFPTFETMYEAKYRQLNTPPTVLPVVVCLSSNQPRAYVNGHLRRIRRPLVPARAWAMNSSLRCSASRLSGRTTRRTQKRQSWPRPISPGKVGFPKASGPADSPLRPILRQAPAYESRSSTTGLANSRLLASCLPFNV